MSNDTGWGGKRKGAGGKKKWLAPGKTVAIRVPEELAPYLLREAKRVDELRHGKKEDEIEEVSEE